MSESLFARIRSGADFWRRDDLSLVAATACAHLISLLAAPLITRMYSPKDFGIYGAFIALTFFDVVLCAGYDRAVVLPKRDSMAYSIAALALTIATVSASLLFLIVWICQDDVARLLGDESLGAVLAWLPLSLLAVAFTNVLVFVGLRRLDFRRVGFAKLTQSSSTAVLQYGFGGSRIAANGSALVVAHVLGALAAVVVLAKQVRRHLRRSAFSISRMRVAAARYARFPKLVAPSALVNSIALQLPILMITKLHGTHAAGLFALTQRTVGAPMVIFGTSLAQIYFARAARQLNKDATATDARSLFLRVGATLFVLGSPLLLLTVPAPWLFETFFGSQWRTSGEIFRLLAPLYFLQLLVAPLNSTLFLGNRQHLYLLGEFLRFAVVVAVFFLASIGAWDLRQTVATYSMAASAGYIVSGGLCWYALRGR